MKRARDSRPCVLCYLARYLRLILAPVRALMPFKVTDFNLRKGGTTVFVASE